MAEITEAQLIAKINAIDAKIDTIISALAGGTGAAQYTSYKIGNKSVSGNQQLKQLREIREMYQKQLEKFPKEIVNDHPFDIEVTGNDETDYQGDE